MSESFKAISNAGHYRDLGAKDQRAIAVAAALDLIAINLQGAHSGGLLEGELDSLASYADKIQEALKVK